MDVITPSQCRAGRALLNWGQPELARRAGVHVQTICAFENETSTPTRTTLTRITGALEREGLEFLPGEGLRRNDSYIRRYTGREEFCQFYDDLYETARTVGGDLCLFNGVSNLIGGWLGPHRDIQVERMMKIRDRYYFRVIVEHGDDVFWGRPYAHYRWFPRDQFNDKTFYIYGSKVAFVNFDNNNVHVIVIDDSEVAASQRLLFNLAWEHIAQEIK